MKWNGEGFCVGGGGNDCLITTLISTTVQTQSEGRVIRDHGKVIGLHIESSELWDPWLL